MADPIRLVLKINTQKRKVFLFVFSVRHIHTDINAQACMHAHTFSCLEQSSEETFFEKEQKKKKKTYNEHHFKKCQKAQR